jgi:hypothetical protein
LILGGIVSATGKKHYGNKWNDSFHGFRTVRLVDIIARGLPPHRRGPDVPPYGLGAVFPATTTATTTAMCVNVAFITPFLSIANVPVLNQTGLLDSCATTLAILSFTTRYVLRRPPTCRPVLHLASSVPPPKTVSNEGF